MRIINGKGYSERDKRDFVPLIYQNILASMHNLVAAMAKLRIDYEIAENQVKRLLSLKRTTSRERGLSFHVFPPVRRSNKHEEELPV